MGIYMLSGADHALASATWRQVPHSKTPKGSHVNMAMVVMQSQDPQSKCARHHICRFHGCNSASPVCTLSTAADHAGAGSNKPQKAGEYAAFLIYSAVGLLHMRMLYVLGRPVEGSLLSFAQAKLAHASPITTSCNVDQQHT